MRFLFLKYPMKSCGAHSYRDFICSKVALSSEGQPMRRRVYAVTLYVVCRLHNNDDCYVISNVKTIISLWETIIGVIFLVYNTQCTLCSVHCRLYSIQCTLYSVYCALYFVHCTIYDYRNLNNNLENFKSNLLFPSRELVSLLRISAFLFRMHRSFLLLVL